MHALLSVPIGVASTIVRTSIVTVGTTGKAMDSGPVRISKMVPAVSHMVPRGTVQALGSRMTPMSVVRRRREFLGVAHL